LKHYEQERNAQNAYTNQFCAPWEERDDLLEWNDEEKGGVNAKFCHYIMCHLLYKHHHFASRRDKCPSNGGDALSTFYQG